MVMKKDELKLVTVRPARPVRIKAANFTSVVKRVVLSVGTIDALLQERALITEHLANGKDIALGFGNYNTDNGPSAVPEGATEFVSDNIKDNVITYRDEDGVDHVLNQPVAEPPKPVHIDLESERIAKEKAEQEAAEAEAKKKAKEEAKRKEEEAAAARKKADEEARQKAIEEVLEREAKKNAPSREPVVDIDIPKGAPAPTVVPVVEEAVVEEKVEVVATETQVSDISEEKKEEVVAEVVEVAVASEEEEKEDVVNKNDYNGKKDKKWKNKHNK